MSANENLRAIATPMAELEINLSLVSHLLQEQHPDLAHLPLQLVDSGWDNVMFRLGDELAVRLPRRKLAATLIEHEQTWLPQLAQRLPVPIPSPQRIGKPTPDYPWCWSVLPWLPGVTADQQELQGNQVEPFVSCLRSLHIPAPANAPHNPFRGVPLQERATTVVERMGRLETKTDLITPQIKDIWDQAVNAPIDVPSTWIHGDLHARNVLVEEGVITGIIDWGDITSGDRATDLAAIWMLFSDRHHRQQAIAQYTNISPATRRRAQGWAIFFGVVLLDTGLVDNPQHALMGERTLRHVAEDLEFQ